MLYPTFKNEIKYIKKGYHFVLGCDEVGVSPLAGPVVAAACLLDPSKIGKYRSKGKWYYRVRDSKTTNEKEREILLQRILPNTLAYGVGVVWEREIDKINIHHASLQAMKLAVEQLMSNLNEESNSKKIMIIVDGTFKIPNIEQTEMNLEQSTMVAGDCHVLSISAASIIAKVHRDNIMRELDQRFPAYGFASHKGYNTKQHQNAIKKLGVTDSHRRSFFRKGWLSEVAGIKSK